MFISRVSLRNYRNFSGANFVFNKGINTIIGENGSGKTNLFRAIRLILDDNLYKYAYRFEETDFNRSIGEWKGHWIIISLEFSELSNDEAIQALFIHGTGIIEYGTVDRGTYTLFFRPKEGIRKKLSKLKENDSVCLNKLLADLTINDYETVFTGKSTADFSNNDIYKELVGDFENVKFPSKFDESKFGVKIPNQLSISKEIAFTFIKALRDVVSDFRSNRTNPLINLLKSESHRIKEDEFKPISDQVNELNKNIEGLEDVEHIRADILDTIKEAVGDTYSPSSLSIKSNLSNVADRLLQSLRLFIGEPQEDYEGGIHELSLGGANIIYLTLKLLEYKYRRSTDVVANFLLIEEPEAHIHTHIQKTLFNNINYGDTQIIISTHSTHISEVSKISRMNILSKKQNYAEIYHPANGLTNSEIVKLERYLDAIRSNLLFAKGVILVEGDAEEILIPILVKETLGLCLDELGISLINIRSTAFKNIAQIFHDDRIRRRCAIITDLDKYIPGNKENSEKRGQERKIVLDDYTKDNGWVKAFYADYTFEVDFVEAGNSWEVQQIIEEVYKDKPTIKKSNDELCSGNVEQYGKRVLTMAKEIGKGWFATMLGKHITFETEIPEYVLRALSFAKSDFSINLITNITEYRLKKLNTLDNFTLDEKEMNEILLEYKNKTINKDDFLIKIKTIIENDQLIDLLEMVK